MDSEDSDDDDNVAAAHKTVLKTMCEQVKLADTPATGELGRGPLPEGQ